MTFLVLTTLITGVVYPSIVTFSAQVLFPEKANGSLLEDQGKVVGSELIGQPFTDAAYFYGRPSATAGFPCNAEAGAGSNMATSNPALHELIAERVLVIRAADPENQKPVPSDLVMASGSGLDPHITRAAADFQIDRIAQRRNLDPARIQTLVNSLTESERSETGGMSRVNVLKLNLALDALK
jgi:K+-transporting ATPase ATPase C chain